MSDRARWLALATGMGCAAPADAYERIERAYGERGRHYHTLRHVRDCLGHFDDARALAAQPDEVELAIWLHDVVYRTRRNDNELRSAELAETWLRRAGAAPDRIRRVHALVLATRHDDAPGTRDEALLQDVDLAILGAADERFDEYETQIRREYRWVPAPLFRRRRAELLEALLGRGSIYRTPRFCERYEEAARANVRRSLEALGRG